MLRLASLSHVSRNLKPDETCGIRSLVLDLVWFPEAVLWNRERSVCSEAVCLRSRRLPVFPTYQGLEHMKEQVGKPYQEEVKAFRLRI